MSDPTVVLVHGAFAESASWGGVISRLQQAGHTTVAAANPLRSLSGDAEFVSAVLDSIAGPVVLVGQAVAAVVVRVRRRRPQHPGGDASCDGRSGRVQRDARVARRLARVDRLPPW